MITVTDSRVLDANSEALGTPVSTLMDNAGSALSDFILRNYPGKKVLFVCGTGNNGGDGFAAALKMPPENTAVALLRKASEIRSDIARDRYSLLECEIMPYSPGCLDEYDVIVDCILGTGMVGKVREPYASCIKAINESSKTIISADIPSGLGMDVAVKPHHTITFHDIKTGMSNNTCGDIHICDIGIPPEASTRLGPGDLARYPIPDKNSHKGQNGRLMIVGGGPYFGAPIMSAMAALRIGADCIRIFTPSSSSGIVSSYNPVFMVTELPGDHLEPGHVQSIIDASGSYDAMLIGPGIGDSEDSACAVREIMRNVRIPTVVDADAIGPLEGVRFETPCILTPHMGEYRRIAHDGMEPEDVSLYMNATVLLKGPVDTITDGMRTRTNHSGNCGMTGAGTGDVLAGCVSGLLSKKMLPFDAACLGAYICGKAGDAAFEMRSYGLIATDIIDCISGIIPRG